MRLAGDLSFPERFDGFVGPDLPGQLVWGVSWDDGDLCQDRLCAFKAWAVAVDQDGNGGGLAAADEFWANSQSAALVSDWWGERGGGTAPDLQHLDDPHAEVEDQRSALVEGAAGDVPTTPGGQHDLQQVRVSQRSPLVADL